MNGEYEQIRAKNVTSSLSGSCTKESVTVQVNIIRLEDEAEWILTVVNSQGMANVWDEPFDNDADAYIEFEQTIEEEGIGAFDGPISPAISDLRVFKSSL